MSEDISQSRDRIQRVHLEANAFAEAMVYSMSNNYLTKFQKALVEAIYQTPIGVFNYVLLSYLAFVEPSGYAHAFLLAAICNFVVAIPIWFAANTAIAQLGVLFVGRSVRNVTHLTLSGFLAYSGDWIGVGLGVASALGMLALVTPSVYLYGVLSKLSSSLHPKYQIAKKLFGVRFPFEDYLTL